MRRDRNDIINLTSVTSRFSNIRNLMEETTKQREDADCYLLDSLIVTQERLQESVIENFGASKEEKDPPKLSNSYSSSSVAASRDSLTSDSRRESIASKHSVQ